MQTLMWIILVFIVAISVICLVRQYLKKNINLTKCAEEVTDCESSEDIKEGGDLKVTSEENASTEAHPETETAVKEEKENSAKDLLKSISEIADTAKTVFEAINKTRQDIEAMFQAEKEIVDELKKCYKWLVPDKHGSDMSLNSVETVRDVCEEIVALWKSGNKPDDVAKVTKMYIDKVADSESTLCGSEEDYHNLALECADHKLYDLACKVCAQGNRRFPGNMDLLADWIEYGTAAGMTDAISDGPMKTLEGCDKEYWNQRVFDALVQYCLHMGKYEEAENIAREFVEYFPLDECSYYCLAEVYLKRYREEDGIAKAKSILDSVMDKNINCVLCANKLAELLSKQGRYKDALSAANRAVQDLAQRSPAIHYSEVYFQRALIQDRMVLEKSDDSEKMQELLEQAILDYDIAIDSRCLSEEDQQQAKIRLKLLEKYFYEF